jgi:hypothetical protein
MGGPSRKGAEAELREALISLRLEVIERTLHRRGMPVRREVVERYGRRIGYSPFGHRLWARPWWWSPRRIFRRVLPTR